MNTIKFNLSKLLLDKRISVAELSSMVNVPYPSVWAMYKRSTIRVQFLRAIEAKLGDCSGYIITKSETLQEN